MQVKTSNDISALIRDRRSHLGWNQQELASRVGVSRLWIIQLEKGKPSAQVGLILRTLRELGIVLDASLPPTPSSKRATAGTVDLDLIINRPRAK